jgi:hypothetical protein
MGAHRLDGLKARRILGGMTIGELAKKAQVSDLTITILENGGQCNPKDTQQILDALAPQAALTSNSQASPTVFVTAAVHTFQTNDTAVIAGVTGANADPNGTRVITRTGTTGFSVAVNCGTAGGTGGTATVTSASVSLVSMV